MSEYVSKIGNKMNKLSGVRDIMSDIQTALSDTSKNWHNLSAGNPAILPEVANNWTSLIKENLHTDEFINCFSRYGPSSGHPLLIDSVVELFNSKYNFDIGKENVLITNGTQTAYFYLSNIFSGEFESGRKKILLPLSPEYTGYSGVSLLENSFKAYKPIVEKFENQNEFKYNLNINDIKLTPEISAVMLSRPTNPSGNVVSDTELDFLVNLVKDTDIPLIIDSAYAPPFPNLCFKDIKFPFTKNTIYCFSLSKTGFPGERVGIVIGDKKYLKYLSAFHANMSIHSSRMGQYLAGLAIKNGSLEKLSNKVVSPYYKKKSDLFNSALKENLPSNINWYVHKAEGSLFTWLWVDHPKFNDRKFYNILKENSLLCVPGSVFFPGLDQDWDHKQQVLRFSLGASDDVLINSTKIISKVLSKNLTD